MGSKDRVKNGSCCPSSSSSVRRPPTDTTVADMSIFNGMDPFWDLGQFPTPMIAAPNQGLDSLESSPKRRRGNQKDPNGEGLDNIGHSPTSRQGRDESNSCASESSKENYIHVRARRGQATNSHSLAERVRREKISERMKLLQDLVPGCNKISGKAVMLDEIINYVQSLQQQVEFLLMKLATVNPELNVDTWTMLSKDVILRSQCGSKAVTAAALGIGPEARCLHPFQGLSLEAIHSFPGSASPFHPLPQNVWNDRLPGILQMGYDSSPLPLRGLEPNTSGLSKMEL